MKTVCIILNFNDATNTLKLAHTVSNFENINDVIMIDNCSTDDSVKQLMKNITNKIHFIQTQYNGGYGYGNNYGMKFAFENLEADAALVVNPDVAFDDVLVYKIIKVMNSEPNIGAVSAMQLDADGTENKRTAWHIPSKWAYIMSTGLLVSRIMKGFYYPLEYLHSKPCVAADCVSGSLLLISKEAFEMTGGYDERMFLYCEETALGCKLKEVGLKAYICSDVGYFHLHGKSISRSIKNTTYLKALMLKSHHVILKDYLKANWFELLIDTVIGKIALGEEYTKSFLRKDTNGGK